MSLFTTATKSLPKVVDLFSPSDSSSSTPSSKSLVDAVSSPDNVSSKSIDSAVKRVASKAPAAPTSSGLSSATGKNISISNLSATAVKNLQVFLQEDSTVGQKTVKLLDGTIVKGIATELSEAKAFQDMVTQIHGMCSGTSIEDRTTARAVNDTLLLEALLLGLAGLIDCLAEVVGLDFSATRIAKQGIVAAKRGDAASLASLSKLVGSAKLKANNPNLVNTLLKNYSLAGDNNPNNYQRAGATLVEQIKTIDTSWMRSDASGDNVKDISSLRGISDDAKTVLSTQSETSTAIMIANDTPQEDQSTLMRRFNPTSLANSLNA